MKKCTNCGREDPDDRTWCIDCGTHYRMRKASPEELLRLVVDQKSFIEFVTALAEERAEAEQMEKTDKRYEYGGAHRWQNSNISDFLYNSLAYFSPGEFRKPEKEPSWKMLAEILYFGKIIE